jgi:hypothetical protein
MTVCMTENISTGGVENKQSRFKVNNSASCSVYLEPNCTHSACIGYLTNQLAAWRRVLLNNLTFVQLVKKLPTICGSSSRNYPQFVELKVLLPCLQGPATCPYPDTLWIKPFKIILILSSRLHINLPRDLFLSVSHTTCSEPVHISLSLVLATCPSHLIVPDLFTRIIFREQYRS